MEKSFTGMRSRSTSTQVRSVQAAGLIRQTAEHSVTASVVPSATRLSCPTKVVAWSVVAMAKEPTEAQLLHNLVEMRDRMAAKYGEYSEQVELIDEAVTEITTKEG